MDVLLVVLAGRRYALPSAVVDEVVPRTRLSPIDGAAPAIAGLMDHRGTLIPVVDGAMLLHDQPSPALLGSRIVVVDGPHLREGGGAGTTRFGLLCDLVIERTTLTIDAGAWHPGGDESHRSIIGAVGRVGSQPMSLIDPARILARERLLTGAATPARLAPATTTASLPSRIEEMRR